MDTIIKEQFKKVISYSQGMPLEPQIDKIFAMWREAKQDFIKAWRGELIYEINHPVCFELSEADKKTRLHNFMNNMYDTYGNEELYRFLDFHQESFFSNHLPKAYALEDGRIIPKGTKIIKAFKFFEDDERVLADLQTQASMIIQEDKINGTLCFSVHPLDFLSLSENTHKWRSCHALDGDYRAGNLSYMLDSSTVVCYLKTTDDAKLNMFPDDVPWNSKKWRMLLFLSTNRDAMFAGRQYPFTSATALTAIQSSFLNSIHSDAWSWSSWYNNAITAFPGRDELSTGRHEFDLYGRHIIMRHKIYCMYDIVEDKSSLHYNDLLHSSCYIPYYCWEKYGDRPISFQIGAQVPCLCCGNTNLELSNSMMCIECEEAYGTGANDDFGYCACCGRRVYRDNMVWNYSAYSEICPECVENESRRCERCGRLHYTCDITYDYYHKMYVCPRCREGED